MTFEPSDSLVVVSSNEDKRVRTSPSTKASSTDTSGVRAPACGCEIESEDEVESVRDDLNFAAGVCCA